MFIDDPVPRGGVLIAPDAIPRTWSFEEISALPNASELLPATVRWFENRYTISDDWPDECFVNHSFSPTGLAAKAGANRARERTRLLRMVRMFMAILLGDGWDRVPLSPVCKVWTAPACRDMAIHCDPM